MDPLFADAIITIQNIGEGNILSANWLACDTIEQYISGIKYFREAFEKIIPENTIWDNRNFRFNIPIDLQQWTDEFLNMTAVNLGFDGKVGIVAGSNILNQVSVAELFEEGKADVKMRFFDQPSTALTWVQTPSNKIQTNNSPIININSLDNGKVQLSFEIESAEFHEYLYLLNRLMKSNNFKMRHAENFSTLTPREKEIFNFVIKGHTNNSIAARLFISCDTVKTHRKKIMRKLECHNISALQQYAVFG